MSKLSLHALDQMYRANSEDPLLMLLHLTFPNSDEYFLVNNTEDITSNGQLYTAFPFTFVLPNDELDSSPELNIVISNIGLDLMTSFRSNIENVIGEVQLVFASVPDFSEITLSNLKLLNISYDARSINAVFSYDDIFNVTVPSQSYTPVDFPGLYNV